MAVEKSCVVCGMGSTRDKWEKTSGEHVACDHHPVSEIEAAIAALRASTQTPQLGKQAANTPVTKPPVVAPVDPKPPVTTGPKPVNTPTVTAPAAPIGDKGKV